MCLPKEEGGLRVKNNHLFNVALLVKWKWRLFSKEKALWGMIIVSKYGLGHRGGSWVLVLVVGLVEGWVLIRKVYSYSKIRFWNRCLRMPISG